MFPFKLCLAQIWHLTKKRHCYFKFAGEAMGFFAYRNNLRFVYIALLAFVIIAAGCARSPDDSYSSIALTGNLSTPYQVLADNFVRRQPPAVYVQPQASLGHNPRALFVPLRTVQQITDAVTFSDLLSRQIWQVWLSQGAFNTLEYAPYAGPFNRDRALAIARSKGAELVVGGTVNHYMDGGQGGESSVSLTIEIYDVKSGNLIWSIAQGGLMEKEKKHNFYLFEVTERNPADPSGLIVRSLAWDMGLLVRQWIDPSFTIEKPTILDKVIGNKAY